jgi:hypothetical protein
MTKSHRLVYDTVYSIDAFERRVVPVPIQKGAGKRFLMLLGCSFTFGEGVSDDETFPAQVARRLPAYHVYNFGNLGDGPNNALAMLEDPSLNRNRGITEAHGDAIFLFIDDHLRRALGTMQFLARNRRGENSPFYALSDDRLVRNGSFRTGRPLATQAYELLGSSQLLRFFNVDLPRLSETNLDLIAAMFERMRDVLQHSYSVDRFRVLIYPNSPTGPEFARLLERRGVETIDDSSIQIDQILSGHATLYGYRHPSPLAYRFLADLLVEDPKAQGLFAK